MDDNLYRDKKKKLRKEYSSFRSRLAGDTVVEKSKSIVRKIVDSDFFNNAKTLMLYMPIKNEVDIREVAEIAWQNNKQIIFPKVDIVTKSMESYIINSWDELELGSYNIYEPDIKNKEPFNIEKIDVIFVPGLVYDKKGYRIGYGGGYYDRFLARINNLPNIIGVAYDFQIIDLVPYEEYDWSADVLVTESQKLVCS